MSSGGSSFFHDNSPREGLEPVPGYKLVAHLGHGGFGEVWKAESPGGFPVALKFVRLDRQAGDIELRSLDILKAIRHANLLGTFGSWRVQNYLILAMELADRTLYDRFMEARGQGHRGIPTAELHEYMLDAAKGIDFLNNHTHEVGGRKSVGIQHRDIKPQNILLIGPSIKVADFGLARLLAGSATGHTGAMSITYAAPEFFHGTTSGRSDQYSLAITYCELLSGELPFVGDSVAQIMAGHLSLPPNLSMVPELERPIVAQALAKDPAKRWESCRAFVEALRSCGVVAAVPRPSSMAEMPTPPPFQAVSSKLKTGSVPPPPHKTSRDAAKLAPELKPVPVAVVSEPIPREVSPALPLDTDDSRAARHDTKPNTAQPEHPRRSGRPRWIIPSVIAAGCLVGVAAWVFSPESGGKPSDLAVTPPPHADNTSQDEEDKKDPKPEPFNEPASNLTLPAREEPKKEEAPPPPPPPPPAKPRLRELPGSFENVIGMKLVKISAGEALLGSPEEEASRFEDEPLRRVRITKGFFIGAHEVTQEQFKDVMGFNPSHFSQGGSQAAKVSGRSTLRFPVEGVSWRQAKDFCDRLSQRLRGEGINGVYRLPTEAEWEYACRAGSSQPFHFGDSLSASQANFAGEWPYGKGERSRSPGRPEEVGSYECNAFGLFDMHGNVWEWCEDLYDRNYYTTGPIEDPPGPSDTSEPRRHVLRGGSWKHAGWTCRSAYRYRESASDVLDCIGFRVVFVPDVSGP